MRQAGATRDGQLSVAYTLWVVDHRRWESEHRALHAGGGPGPTTGAAPDVAVRGVAARNLSHLA